MDQAELGPGELRRRATGGVALLLARGALILGFGVGANVVLARLLAPRDFGIVALGTVLLVFGGFLADGGLGAALLRREASPTRTELEAVNAAQVAATLALALVFTGGAVVAGRDGLVVALMVASLPITILKTPSHIVLERQLRYRLIATVDVLEALTFYAWALVTVALGMGVWGMASGMVARALAGAVAMIRLGPIGLVRPRWSRGALRPLFGFGAKFQTNTVLTIVRDQGLNVGIAIVAGVSTLGVWNLAWRVLQAPFMVMGTLGRIGYPAMARLLRAGVDPRPVLERGLGAVAVVTGAVVVALVGFAPALPALVGPGWSDVPAVLLWAGIALIASASRVGTAGYLFAAHQAGAVVLATFLGAVVWLALALPLLPALGAPAAAVGWCAGSVVQVLILARRTAVSSGASVGSSLAAPTGAGLAAAVLGWLVADAAGRSVAAGILGMAAAELVLFAALAAVSRTALRDTLSLVRDALGNFAGRGEPRASPAAGAGGAPRQIRHRMPGPQL